MWARDVWDAIAFRAGKWLFFGVLLALFPIALGALGVVTRKAETFSFEALLGRGELLLVTSAVLGAALAELVGDHDPRFRTLRLYCACSAGTVLIAAASWFADVAGAVRDGTEVDGHAVAVGSLWLFGSAVAAGIACLIVVEASKSREPTAADGNT
jgi:hypothetical protein